MPELTRLTTEFVPIEDRIRITGESGPDNTTITLWLTQRLANQLVPHLCAWLENKTGSDMRGEIMQNFAQQAALAAMEPQPPVQASEEGISGLVRSMNIQTGDEGVRLIFGQTDERREEDATLTLQTQALRQWLGIVHSQYLKGGWPLTVWPDWIRDAKATEAVRAASALH
jgi:hypothetical protein